jgi:hypothetical protein
MASKAKSASTDATLMSEKALRAATMAKLKADAQYEKALERVTKEEVAKSNTKAKGAKGKLRILAEGDSWFRYGCGIGVVTQLQRRLQTKAIITNIAAGGETMKKMLTLPTRAEFEQRLREGADRKPWDAVLFSGGGNDFCGKKFHTWLLPFSGQTVPKDAVDRATWQPKLQELADLYVELATVTARLVPGALVYINIYDFAIPNNTSAGPAGPWLAPGFKKRGYPADLEFRTKVVRLLLEEFAVMIKTVAASHPNLRVVPTQGTLTSKEWDNELHPDNPGFGKIADLFAANFP